MMIWVTISYSQEETIKKRDTCYTNVYFDVKMTIDPGVMIDETNLNLKLEASTHFNGHNHWRANVVFEVLTGHDGYYGMDVGVGYSIPYNIGTWRFKVEPGIGVGMIVRPNMPTLVTSSNNGMRVYSNEGFVGFSHTLNLRHKLNLFDSRWSLYIHNRLILRSDLHFEQELTVTPNELPFYNVDNAIGVSYAFQ